MKKENEAVTRPAKEEKTTILLPGTSVIISWDESKLQDRTFITTYFKPVMDERPFIVMVEPV